MVENKHEDLIEQDFKNEIDSIQVPKGLKEEIWNKVKPYVKPKKKRKNFMPLLAAVACIAILIPIGMSMYSNHFNSSSGHAPSILGDSHPPVKPKKIASILSKTEAQLKTSSEIVTTASAFDGKKTIKFRLMVNGVPSKQEAAKLFNDIIKTVNSNANNIDVWNYYNGQFDIKNYTNGVIYTASKKAKKSMVITKK